MSAWSLPRLLGKLHDDIERRLATVRETFEHSGTKGDASEHVWLEFLKIYLPERYRAERAHVVDSNGAFSQQMDVVVFDRQYSPLIFTYEGQTILPAESVYAVFEAKQSINAEHVGYAREKVASVRRLVRTSLPIPYVEGTYRAKALTPILGGILTFESDWTPPLGDSLVKALEFDRPESGLDIGCVAAHGMFTCSEKGCYVITPQGKPATAFLLELIARLQSLGTVPMIDTRAYSRWLVAE
jgi:hypothetical protein